MNYTDIGSILILLIVMYFLFNIGIKLANYDYGEQNGLPWSISILGLFFGWTLLNGNNPLGFVGFIPIVTYILMKILQVLNFDYYTRKKITGISLSITGSVINYIVVHSIFGFGIPEASITAVITAVILSIMGYTG